MTKIKKIIPLEYGSPAIITIVIFSFCLFNANVVAFIQPIAAQESHYFNDEFDDTGETLNSTKWNTQVATNGSRWCSTTIGSPLNSSGQWLDVSFQPCNDVTQTPPYGNVTINNGFASLSSQSGHTFPFFWNRAPLLSSDPNGQDFVFEIRMKYDKFSVSGDGVVLLDRPSNPNGNNFTRGANGIMSIWAGFSGISAALYGQNVSVTSNPYGFHKYTLENTDGQFSLYVDGILRSKSAFNHSTPATIWIGNPVFTQRSSDWSDFTIDYIRVGENRTSIASTEADSDSVNLSNFFFGGELPRS